MKLKPARLALTGVSAVFLFISLTVAQDIGHLGVNTDPIPLVQAKRARTYMARNSGRPQNLIARGTDPGSRDMRADVSGVGGASGRVNTAASQPTAQSAAPSTTQLPSASSTGTNVAPVNVNSTAVAAAGANAPKAATTPFDAAIAKAEDFASKNDARGAVTAYREALNIKPDSVEAQLGLADSLQDVKDFAGAEAEFKKIAEQTPASADARRGRADALYELKKYDEAVAEYQAAIKAGANDAGVYNNLGNALFRTGTRENRDLAVDNYRKAIQKDQKWAESYAGLANVLRVQKRTNEAQAEIDKALQISPASPLAHSVAGRVYADLNDFTRANAEAQKAIDLAPKDAFAYLNLAGIQYMQGRLNEAIRTYVIAQSYDRTWAVPHNSLGNLYLSANRPLEASEEFEIAAKLEPKSSIIHNNLGAAYTKLQKYDLAIQNYQTAAQLDPKNPNPQSNMGLAYVRQGRYNEAVAAFTRALEIEPNNAAFQVALADSLNLAGRKKEAKEAYKRAEEMGAKVKKK